MLNQNHLRNGSGFFVLSLCASICKYISTVLKCNEMETEEQINNRPWLYKKGQSGNPGGRPKGSKTLKTYIKERFESMTDEEREEYLDGMPKEMIWKMGEGNPDTKTDLTSKGEKLPTPILHVFNNDINKENSEAQKEN